MSVAEEILIWSRDRPPWQRDALRRIVVKGELNETDLAELVLIAKEQRGLVDPSAPAPEAVHLAANQMPTLPTTQRVSLGGIKDVRNVNALAQDQELLFGSDGLTVVYGDNATGKSGYVRILKKVCRARAADTPILPNVFDRLTGEPPRARIKFSVGTTAKEFSWEEGSPSPDDLTAVSVFDSPSAAVYVNRTKNDVAYVPLGLDLLTKLAETCDRIGAKLREEMAAYTVRLDVLPQNLAATPSGQWFRTITRATSAHEIGDHATFSTQDAAERDRLQKVLSEENPEQRAAELEGKRGRFEKLRCNVRSVSEILTTTRIEHFKSATRELRDAEKASALAIAQRTGGTPVAIVGIDAWERLWEAAQAFREEIHARHQGELLEDPERCPLCLQALDNDAKARFKAFTEYFLAKAESDEATKRNAFLEEHDLIAGLNLAEDLYRPTIEELNIESPSAASDLERYLRECRLIQQFAENALASTDLPKVPAVPSFDARQLASIIDSTGVRAEELRAASDPEKIQSLRDRELQLEAKHWLSDRQDQIAGEIQRQHRHAQMKLALSDTVTTGITRKSTELTKRYVTDELRTAFGNELANMSGEPPKVELTGQPGEKGTSYYRLQLSGAILNHAEIKSVLSEGELGTISLAAFLSELSTEETKSAVVIDDPISTLDVWNRDRVAERVAKLASERQVIVFTHSLGFLISLLEQAKRRDAALSKLMLVKTPVGAGVVKDDLPWEAQKFKGLIGKLRKDCQGARGASAKSDLFVYEAVIAKICKELRMAVERAVEDVLLSNVVGRYQRQLHLTNIRRLPAIEEGDVELLDRLMTKYSSYEHIQPPESRSPLPGIGEVERDVVSLAEWANDFNERAGT